MRGGRCGGSRHGTNFRTAIEIRMNLSMDQGTCMCLQK